MTEYSGLYSIYASDSPRLIGRLAAAPEMRRLKDVRMHCGCEYVDFPIYRRAKGGYSRFMHSLGVANIVWHFSKDIRQAVAGLLHDIATPVFAHTIDFMNGDHVAQESTESGTRQAIENAPVILHLLYENGIEIDEVADYHRYPIADNSTPMLSADRLEYTLGNAFLVHGVAPPDIGRIYHDLFVAKNEHGNEELCFRSLAAAKAFTALSLKNSRWFISDENRFSMQFLADCVRSAVENGVLKYEDLFATERPVIQKLAQNEETRALWNAFTQISAVSAADEPPPAGHRVKVAAKKRFIDPLVMADRRPVRLTKADGDTAAEINAFLATSFDRWIFLA